MVSRGKFVGWLAVVLMVAAGINISFFRRAFTEVPNPNELTTVTTSQRRAMHRDPPTLAPQSSSPIETLQVENNVVDTEFIPPLDDEAVRKDISCQPSSVVLNTHTPDIEQNFSSVMQGLPTGCQCAKAVLNDVDHGLTLSHVMKRRYCHRYSANTNNKNHHDGSVFRVLQVGANTGDNANDHLVTFLKAGVAQGVLLEPVPWIFRRLSETYRAHHKTVRLLNAAMSEVDGNVSFVAPKEKASGWLPQMGGLNLPPKTLKTLKKQGGLKLFDKITVRSTRFDTLLKEVTWDRAPPDVFVVDAEGYDATIVHMVLDAVSRMFGDEGRIPIIQWEWKHLAPSVRAGVWHRMTQLGYCVMQVHYDDIAVHTDALKQEIGEEGGHAMCERSYQLKG